MSITIVSPGLLTTVQDMGRVGYQQFGVPVSGVVDPYAAAVANILLGNDENEAVLECTLLGPSILFHQDISIVIGGGDLGANVDGHAIQNYRAYQILAGQTLSFTGPKSGCRAYIAFAGGLDIPQVMGSRSTYMKAKIGGLKGRKLVAGDEIAFRAPRSDVKFFDPFHDIRPEFNPQPEYTVRVILGPQDDAFTAEGIRTFLNSTYTMTSSFDRMGSRLDGPVIRHVTDGNIISDGISFGAIQVPSAGTPIIMMADRQTTGGYTKIANVISADFRIIAQLKTGDKIRFRQVTVQQAQKELAAQRKTKERLKKTIRRYKLAPGT